MNVALTSAASPGGSVASVTGVALTIRGFSHGYCLDIAHLNTGLQ